MKFPDSILFGIFLELHVEWKYVPDFSISKKGIIFFNWWKPLQSNWSCQKHLLGIIKNRKFNKISKISISKFVMDSFRYGRKQKTKSVKNKISKISISKFVMDSFRYGRKQKKLLNWLLFRKIASRKWKQIGRIWDLRSDIEVLAQTHFIRYFSSSNFFKSISSSLNQTWNL